MTVVRPGLATVGVTGLAYAGSGLGAHLDPVSLTKSSKIQMGTQSKASPDSMVIDMGDSVINSNFNEENWISKIKGILNEEQLGHEIDNPTNCIFQVPKSVSSIKPEAFIPQRIALGPYHHFRPKFYKMQKCKLHEVQIVHQRLKLPEFQLFDQLKRKVKDVRGYYHEHLDIHDDTLSWIMVIDEEKALTPTASQLSSVKVKFCHTGLGISFICFTKEDTALHLPVLL
ncbi:hypothetical protein GH714_032214 [Hevea brasiliensis]|uniref:Uncharacterized protein n=1 Tax=Hevea brasiliensis TaxID=3981 RepID=A0A6A6N9S0_HEVBR|nr:hypothetical protein GH714_032214 [Hevea brasiliensis]